MRGRSGWWERIISMGWKRGAKSLFLEVHASSVAAELHGDQVTHKHLTFALLYLNQASASPKVIWRVWYAGHCDKWQQTAKSSPVWWANPLCPLPPVQTCFLRSRKVSPDALGHQVNGMGRSAYWRTTWSHLCWPSRALPYYPVWIRIRAPREGVKRVMRCVSVELRRPRTARVTHRK